MQTFYNYNIFFSNIYNLIVMRIYGANLLLYYKTAFA